MLKLVLDDDMLLALQPSRFLLLCLLLAKLNLCCYLNLYAGDTSLFVCVLSLHVCVLILAKLNLCC
jgi:hypothetical protein